MSSVGYHEPIEELSDATRDMHRAIVSLMEELEAIDWYQQRVDATDDPELKSVLAHNRDEEKEHAVMVMEWLRRRDTKFDELMRELLFKEGPIKGEHESPAIANAVAAPPPSPGPRLTVGRLIGSDSPK